MARQEKVIWLPKGWQPVCVGFCPSAKAWEKHVCRMGLHGLEYPTTAGRATFFESGGKNDACVIVTLGDGERTDIETHGLLAHEAVHVWQYCCQVMGEDRAGDEIEAYAIQAIAQMLMEAYHDTVGNKKD